MSNGDATPAAKKPLHGLEAHAASLLHRRVSRNLNVVQAEQGQSLGLRMADTMAKGAGSWGFIIGFLSLIAIWMVVNAIAGLRHWDPYPFILLNLLLSSVAAVQAPIILMSQNREEARDRTRAEADYDVNLKSEVLLEHLVQEVESLKTMLAEGRRQQGE